MQPLENRPMSFVCSSDVPADVVAAVSPMNDRSDRNEQAPLHHVAQQVLPAERYPVAGQRLLDDGGVCVVHQSRFCGDDRFVRLGEPLVWVLWRCFA